MRLLAPSARALVDLQVPERLCVTPSADVFSLEEEGEKRLLVFCLFPPSFFFYLDVTLLEAN